MISIRRVDTADPIVRHGIDLMISECFVPSDWTDLKLPRVRRDYGAWWVAYVDKKPVGFVSVVGASKVPNAGYLHLVGVVPSARGHGLQKRMTKKVEEYAREKGWKRVVSDTVNTNVASMRSFIACGFRPFTPDEKWAATYAVYWTKSL